jgi:hypothetical protein
MAGKIIADTLEHSTAGSVTTDYVVNGSAKAWVNFNGSGTIAARNSLNTSGLVDNGTGDYNQNFTNSFSAADFAFVMGGKFDSGASNLTQPITNHYRTTQTSSTVRIGMQVPNTGADGFDGDTVTSINHGDLA